METRDPQNPYYKDAFASALQTASSFNLDNFKDEIRSLKHPKETWDIHHFNNQPVNQTAMSAERKDKNGMIKFPIVYFNEADSKRIKDAVTQAHVKTAKP